jgi:hypothetical protein
MWSAFCLNSFTARAIRMRNVSFPANSSSANKRMNNLLLSCEWLVDKVNN